METLYAETGTYPYDQMKHAMMVLYLRGLNEAGARGNMADCTQQNVLNWH